MADGDFKPSSIPLAETEAELKARKMDAAEKAMKYVELHPVEGETEEQRQQRVRTMRDFMLE